MSTYTKLMIVLVVMALGLFGYVAFAMQIESNQRMESVEQAKRKKVGEGSILVPAIKVIIQPGKSTGSDIQKITYTHNLGYTPGVEASFKDLGGAPVKLPWSVTVRGPETTSNTESIDIKADNQKIVFTRSLQYNAPYGNSMNGQGVPVDFILYNR